MPRVSVLVIAGTGRPYLRAALDSLVHQDDGDWQAIVVEACADERDTNEVQRQIDEVGDSRVRQIVFDGVREYPPYASRKWNFALERSDSDFVAFLDDDDAKEGNWVSAMCAPLVANESLAATACNGVTIDRVGARQGQLFGFVSLDYDHLLRGNFVTTGQIMVRRSVVEEIGAFDAELSCAEDYDFCLRLAGRPWALVESTRCLKRDSGDNACYAAGGWTQAALRKIIAKHGAPYTCYGCGGEFSAPDESFIWCVDKVGFRNWHYGCTQLPPESWGYHVKGER